MVKVKKVVKKRAQAKEDAEEPKVEAPASAETEKKEAKVAATESTAKKAEEPKKAPSNKKKSFESSASPEEKAKLTKAAVKKILRGISNPETKKTNAAFIPAEWHLKFKAALGPYKQFVATQAEHFKIHELVSGGWLVLKVGEEPPAVQVQEAWKRALSRAWDSYCGAVPQHERSIENFIAGLPQGTSDDKPEPAPAKAEEAPAAKEDPSEEAAAEEPGTTKKKLKRKADSKAEDAPKKKEKKAHD